jgi:diadenosine tetraphosphate (Ap4A) HIT family hydrolase
MPTTPACIFCRILTGEAEASLVYEDENLAAFLDIFPMVHGHSLVVPRRHLAGLADLDSDLGGKMIDAGRKLATAMRPALGCQGVNLFLADGTAAGQTVFHVHLHVLPRSGGDGFGLRRGLHSPPARHELEEQARRLRKALGSPS